MSLNTPEGDWKTRMPAVRTDRCPHCWAALAPEVGPACPHCRKSLLPVGRKARQAYEQERLAHGERPAPQPAHPRQPEPPQFVAESVRPTPPPPPPSASVEARPAEAASAPAAAWGAPDHVPPAHASGRRPVIVTALMVIGALLGLVGGGIASRGVLTRVLGTKTSVSSAAGEPTVYDGPTFSVRLPGHVDVQHMEQSGITVTYYMSEFDDLAVGVAVTDLPAGASFDFKGGAQGIVANAGGRIASDQAVDVAGRPAHDLLITGMKGGKATGWWRLIVDGTRVYQVSAIGAGSQTERPAGYVTALDSFTIR